MSLAPQSPLEEARVEGGGRWERASMSCQLSRLVQCYLIELREGRRVLRSLCCPIGTHSKRLGPPVVEGVAMIPALMYNEDKEAIRCWGLCSDTLEFGLLSPLFGASTS